jgi:5-methylcytosine-specific restriction endonuclease McrA
VERTLLLNATYEPLRVVSWQRAVTLLIKGKVEVLAAYDRVIRGVSISLEHPSVLRLRQRVRVAKRFHNVPFSRANIYLRDKNGCQYCARRLPSSELTLDHVIPASQGGRKDWENIVTCCIECNRRKGGMTPDQAGLQLIRTPKRPTFLPALRITLGIGEVPESWRAYLYWHREPTG